MHASNGRRRVLQGLLAAVSLAACACGNALSEEEDEAEAMQRRFLSLVGDSYSCDYQNVFFVVGPVTEPVRMTVRGARIASLVSLRTGQPIPSQFWGQFLTVEGVFAEIQEAARRGVAELRVLYDERYAYPQETYIDVNANTIDEERRYLISNLQPER